MSKIEKHSKIGIDSMLFIYLFEDNPDYSDICASVLEGIEKGDREGITSAITLLEILVKPKIDGNQTAIDDYKDIITNFPNLKIIDVDLAVADIASTLRAKYSIKTPDAIQVATAIKEGCSLFITNDFALKKIEEIEVVAVKDILSCY
ncbi:Q3M7V5 PilT like protein [Methanolobus psychrophilus R15]|nr:Q3M7V5 PilT like protein [Methanolobus psychrophilus R15]